AVLRHEATADVALLKLAAPLPGTIAPAPLAALRPVVAGDRLLVGGYGVAVRRDGRTGGTVRDATLIATTDLSSTLQVRLANPETRGARAAIGACTGDSGAPVFVQEAMRVAVVGVVSWSTGPNLSDGCGGLTGV